MKNRKSFYGSKIRHIHLEPTSNCNARCPQCPRTFFTSPYTDPGLKISEWLPEELNQVINDDVFSCVKKVLVNGNYGDIVSHTRPKELLQVLFDKKIFVEIRTNGAALGVDFWKWLGRQPNLLVEFGIDGLSDTHHLYRRNTRYDVVMKNAEAYIKSGGKASWAMTIFKHNEHQIEECEKISKDIGFEFFKARSTTRWPEKNLKIMDKKFNEIYELTPASDILKSCQDLPEHQLREPDFYRHLFNSQKYSLDYSENTNNNRSKIDCSVQKSSSVYLSAEKKLWPCCWTSHNVQTALKNGVDTSITKKFYKELKYDQNFNNVTMAPIHEILEKLSEISYMWKSEGIDVCQAMCTKKDGKWRKQLLNTDIRKNS